MPDPFGADFERGPDGFRARGFARMTAHPQSSIARIREDIAKPFRRSSRFIPADAVSNCALLAPGNGKFGDTHARLGAKMPHRIDNPKGFHAGPLGFLPPLFIYRPKILILPHPPARR